MRKRRVYFKPLSVKEEGRQAAIYYRKWIKALTEEQKNRIDKGEITIDEAIKEIQDK